MTWMNGMPGTGRALSRTVRAATGWRGQKLQFLDRPEDLPRPLPCIGVFWGDRDRIIPADHAEALVARMDNVSFMRFAGSGHFPQQEEPAAFASALSRFLDAPDCPRATLKDVQAIATIPARVGWWQSFWISIREWVARLFGRFRRRRLPPG